MNASAYLHKKVIMKNARDKILNAALKTFSRNGLSGSSTRAIAKEAGVNEVTLFRHFGNKKNLFAEVIQRYSAIPDIDEARGAPDEPLPRRLDELGKRIIAILDQRKNMIAILLSDASKNKAQAKTMLECGPGQVLAHLTEWFEQEKERGEMRDLDPECVARAFMGMFFMTVLMQKILPGDSVMPIDLDKAHETFIDVLLHGILPREDES
ncbi:MAG: TetR family transcriptional regulator [bacterium]|nr:TetR family transcriptional regulator [bacterium]